MEARNLNRIEWSGDWSLERMQGRSLPERWLHRGAGTLRLWLRRARNRRQLRGLLSHDRRFFADIGVSRATVYTEGSKWFWQA